MKKRYAISDIHGCSQSLNSLLFEKLQVGKDDELYFLGDYIDRGPDSKGVLDLLMKMKEDGYSIVLLRGNHEQMLLDSVDSVPDMDMWVLNGCDATLNSFNAFHPNEIPEKYLNFIDNLPYYHELQDFVLVHGGLNFDIEDPLSDKKSMLWIRNSYIHQKKIGNRRIVVGHTPKTISDIENSLNDPKIIIDGGCCYSKKYINLGKLVALDLDSLELHYTASLDK